MPTDSHVASLSFILPSIFPFPAARGLVQVGGCGGRQADGQRAKQAGEESRKKKEKKATASRQTGRAAAAMCCSGSGRPGKWQGRKEGSREGREGEAEGEA